MITRRMCLKTLGTSLAALAAGTREFASAAQTNSKAAGSRYSNPP